MHIAVWLLIAGLIIACKTVDAQNNLVEADVCSDLIVVKGANYVHKQGGWPINAYRKQPLRRRITRHYSMQVRYVLITYYVNSLREYC